MSYKHPEYVRGSGRNRWYYIPELDEWCHYTIMRRRLAKLGMTLADYYDKYLMTDESEKVCKYCGKPTTFISICAGYRLTCKNHLCIKRLRSDIVNSPSTNEKIRQSAILQHANPESKLRHKIGTKVAMQRPEVKEKQLAGLHSPECHAKLINITPKRRESLRNNMLQMHAQGKFVHLHGLNYKHAKAGYVQVSAHCKYRNIRHTDDGALVVHLKSLDEQAFVQMIEQLGYDYDISACKIPYLDDSGKSHVYVVDFTIFLNNGKKLLIECKPYSQVNDFWVQLKAKAAIEYVKSHFEYCGYEFYFDAKYTDVVKLQNLINKYENA